ncbi:hypothetical protein MYX75_10805 [Acidobacteria bacterium AH-259-A15]|nr:hypothetical protein [Acidobacteria bacterium AH-259-A15]
MKGRSESGFTLVEAALVGLLILIIAGFAIPQLQRSLSNYRLSASANLVAGELNAGRSLAVSRNWIYAVQLDTNNSTIQIIDPSDADNAPRRAKSLESGITFSSVPASPITLYSRGHAEGGAIVLQNQDGNTISVTVSASGKVEIGAFS